LEELTSSFSKFPKEKKMKGEWIEASVHTLIDRAKSVLNLSSLSIDPLLERGFVRSTQEFVDNLKEFDPQLKIENVYQALRNVWIMNSLQFYLNLPIEHTESIFAYSLIYPYTDNYLDDERLSIDQKILMMLRLREWLEGQDTQTEETRERKIQKLIRKIEKQYDRTRYPRVYQSLLAIFNGQVKSLLQQRRKIDPSEVSVLDISLEKGGTSVLADGYLVKGDLSLEQADFCFGFGLFLQLADDIQDIVEDRKNKHITLFSAFPPRRKRDELANRLLLFMKKVCDLKLKTDSPDRSVLKDLILDNCTFLVLDAVGRNRGFYSRKYLSEMESFFPVRFSFLETIKRKVENSVLAKAEHVVDLDVVSAALLSIASRTVL
jgi:hypothetical protein